MSIYTHTHIPLVCANVCELILNWLFPIVVAAAAAAFRVIRLTKKERNNDIVSWTFILINELAQSVEFTLPLPAAIISWFRVIRTNSHKRNNNN